MNFDSFNKELQRHNAEGYHIVKKIDFDILGWFLEKKLSPNNEYKLFLEEVGFGRFFDGSLVIFPLDKSYNSIIEISSRAEEKNSDLLIIGYNGTNEGYFCVDKYNPAVTAIYWIDNFTGERITLNTSFRNWIENTPTQLFNEKIYLGFKPVKNKLAIDNIVAKRECFKVELIDFNRILVKPPGKESDLLPRYNTLSLKVTKLAINDLNELTIKVLRTGSAVKNDNIEYITIQVSTLQVGVPTEITAYLFDPFNLPFDSIALIYEPQIQLSSKMRVKYKEILPYL